MSKEARPNGEPDLHSGISRRNFMKTMGATTLASASYGASAMAQQVRQADREEPLGPGQVPVKLSINGKTHSLQVEPRVTLLEALRYELDMTGSKEGCDRATCGACTVLLDGDPVYACMVLAVDAQRKKITTIEGLGKPENLAPIQAAFVKHDALMCGFCTPGFVLSAHALLEKNPSPDLSQIKKSCSGNVCRCGTQPHIIHAIQETAGLGSPPQPEIITLNHEELA